MTLKDRIRKLTPYFLLKRFRKYKKEQVNKDLFSQKDKGVIVTKESLKKDFENIGLKSGDTVLAHTSMSKLGYLENGANTFIDALIEFIGPEGNVLMPSSPNDDLQLNYAKNNPVFNVDESPSRLGKITEVFRTYKGVKRSLCPTEPVCGVGKDIEELLDGHIIDNTPYSENSPFRKINKLNAKILYIGCTLDNAGTSLHTLEDAVKFPYPVYAEELFEFKVIQNEKRFNVFRYVHNPVWSKKRKCDMLIPYFIEKDACQEVKIANASTLIFDSRRMYEAMIEGFEKERISMYFPSGEISHK